MYFYRENSIDFLSKAEMVPTRNLSLEQCGTFSLGGSYMSGIMADDWGFLLFKEKLGILESLRLSKSFLSP